MPHGPHLLPNDFLKTAEFVSCRAIWCSVMETRANPHTHTHTHTHQPAPFSPAIQTHSHAFTHLLCPPHEELKIDDSTTKRVGIKRGTGEKDEEGSPKKTQSSSKMRGGRGRGRNTIQQEHNRETKREL